MTAYAAGLLSKGKASGEEHGRKLAIYEAVYDGDLSFEKGANRLGITVEELKRNMLLEGFKFPEQ